MKKNNSLHLRIATSDKEKLKIKAKNLGLNPTQYIEKVAREPIIFMDKNIKKFMKKLQK